MKQYEKTTCKISEIVTKQYSTSFYTASLLFEADIRKAIFSIYGFVRFADEIVDTFHNYNQKELLDKFEHDFKYDLHTGLSINPVLHSFILIVKEYSVDIHLIDDFMLSMRKDLTISEYDSSSNLEQYIYGSAEVVGLMCLKVFCKGNSQQYNNLKNEAKSLGAAFQKVNFLRDLNEDMFTLNRTYFPQIQHHKFCEITKKQIISDIEKDFTDALKGIKKIPKEAKTAVYVAYLYYMKLLKKIKKTPAKTILNKRIRVPNYVKLGIILKGIFICKLNLIR